MREKIYSVSYPQDMQKFSFTPNKWQKERERENTKYNDGQGGILNVCIRKKHAQIKYIGTYVQVCYTTNTNKK